MNFCNHISSAAIRFRTTTNGYDAIDIINQIGGIPIIAHPKSIENDDIVRDLLRYGAQGLEVFHPVHSIKETQKYKLIAKENKKYVTGGSDWHGKNNGSEITHFAMTGLEHENYEILKNKNFLLKKQNVEFRTIKALK